MTVQEWDNQFWEWLVHGGPYPREDSITVPYPINFTPIPITQVINEERIEVRCV